MIIGLYSSAPRSGKTTFANTLCAIIPKHTYTISFADILRELVVSVTAPFLDGGEDEAWEWLDDERKDNGIIPDLGVTFRHMLQTLGTEWGRRLIHPDIWVMLVQKRIDFIEHYDDKAIIIIDDLRFPNEHKMLMERGATLIKLVNTNLTNREDLKNHVSNGAIDAFEFHQVITESTAQGVVEAAETFAVSEGLLAHWPPK